MSALQYISEPSVRGLFGDKIDMLSMQNLLGACSDCAQELPLAYNQCPR